MSARTSLTGVTVASGYVQLLHVGDDSGIEAALHQIFDGNGTGTCLKLGTVSMTVTLGTSAGNDYILTNGTEMFKFEGETVKLTLTFDASPGSDLELNDGSNADWLYQSDDGTITLGSAVNYIFNTTTGTKFGTAANQKIGLWGATAIVQPSGTGETSGFTAGSGTAVLEDSTFTGNTGSKAYRISDVVKALKTAGLMAAS